MKKFGIMSLLMIILMVCLAQVPLNQGFNNFDVGNSFSIDEPSLINPAYYEFGHSHGSEEELLDMDWNTHLMHHHNEMKIDLDQHALEHHLHDAHTHPHFENNIDSGNMNDFVETSIDHHGSNEHGMNNNDKSKFQFHQHAHEHHEGNAHAYLHMPQQNIITEQMTMKDAANQFGADHNTNVNPMSSNSEMFDDGHDELHGEVQNLVIKEPEIVNKEYYQFVHDHGNNHELMDSNLDTHHHKHHDGSHSSHVHKYHGMPSTQPSSTITKDAVSYSEQDQVLMENDYDQLYSEQDEMYNHGPKVSKSKYEDHSNAHPDGALKYGNGPSTYGSTSSEYHKDERIKIKAQDAYVHGMSHEHMDSHVHGMSFEHMDSQYHNQGGYQSSSANSYDSNSVTSNNYATIEDDHSHDRNDVAVKFGNGPGIHEVTNNEYHHTSNYNDYGGKYGNDKLSDGNQNLAISNQHSTPKLSTGSKGNIADDKVHIDKISSGISYVPVEHVTDASYLSSVPLKAGGVSHYATNPTARSALSVSKNQANYDTQSDYYNELSM